MDHELLDDIVETARDYWSNVIGAVIFGSYARAQKHEDIDLLLVLEAIEKDRIERIEEIVGFKRKINAKIDLLLLSKEECRANFQNHNPHVVHCPLVPVAALGAFPFFANQPPYLDPIPVWKN